MPAGFFGLFLEFLQVADNFERIGAAVWNIPHLHQVGVAGHPLSTTVNNPGFPQRSEITVVIAVDISDSHNALNALPIILNVGRC